jgi:DNA-binding response OmpR family regulator
MIFLTAARTSDVVIERGLKMGVDDYMCKPIDGAALRERLRTVVERGRDRPARTRE